MPEHYPVLSKRHLTLPNSLPDTINLLNQQKKSPIILITTPGYRESVPFYRLMDYTNAVRTAGGTPFLLPPGEANPQFLEFLNGILFTGGGDIHPGLYGHSLHPTTYSVDEQRDTFEIELARFALIHHIPVFGICRGMQILNVASGGTLLEHVPEQFDGCHRLETPGQIYPSEHWIDITFGSRLAQITESHKFLVVSWHHMAVEAVAPGWRVVAYAEDGAIEAIEHENHPFALGVQFHPELSHSTPHQQLFKAFVEAARYRSCS